MDARLDTLDSADVCWEGHGEGGKTVRIGLERKRLRDAISGLREGRFLGFQAGKLLAQYDRAILLIEGAWRPGPDGELLTPSRGKPGEKWRWLPLRIGSQVYMYRELDNWLNSVANITGIRVVRTQNAEETAHHITDSWHWWSKEWDKHKSTSVFHHSGPVRVELAAPSLVRKVAKELPGIGWEKSKDVEIHFPTVLELATAGESEWCQIPGVGKATAKKIVRVIGSRE
jgi:ERCC4-type nuclease